MGREASINQENFLVSGSDALLYAYPLNKDNICYNLQEVG